jgi:hypothetical protein
MTQAIDSGFRTTFHGPWSAKNLLTLLGLADIF